MLTLTATGWCNLFNEVKIASGHFTASNLSAPTNKYCTPEFTAGEDSVISSLL